MPQLLLIGLLVGGSFFLELGTPGNIRFNYIIDQNAVSILNMAEGPMYSCEVVLCPSAPD